MEILETCQDCVIYARYSSANQKDASIEQQVAECEAFAKYNGLRVVKVYADRHLSGTNDNRPQFQQMLKDAERGRWSVILTWKVDRFARNRYDSATYKHRLKKHGVRVVYAKESIPDGPEGILLESILEGAAEYYSANLAQNIRRGLQFNAEQFIPNGGRMPYGFRRSSDGRYEIIESEAAIVREIFERASAGEMYSRIVEDLRRRGVPTKHGGTWHTTTIRTILSNEIYAGVYHFGNIRGEGKAPQIVDLATYKEAKMRVDSTKGTKVRSQNYLFTGRIRCGLCGEPLVGRSGHGRSGVYAYYTCRGHRKKECIKKPVPRNLLEERVVSGVLEVLSDPAVVSWIADAAVEMQKKEAQKNAAAPDALRSELAAVKKSINGVMSAIEQGIITPTTKERLTQLEAEKTRLECAIQDAQLPIPTVDREFIVYYLSRFQNQDGTLDDPETRRDLASSVISSLRVFDDHVDVTLNYSGENKTFNVPLDIPATGSPYLHNALPSFPNANHPNHPTHPTLGLPCCGAALTVTPTSILITLPLAA